MITELIQQAKDKYPLSIYVKGKLSEEEIAEIEKVCDIRCPSVYMDGSAAYCIRYKGSEALEYDSD